MIIIVIIILIIKRYCIYNSHWTRTIIRDIVQIRYDGVTIMSISIETDWVFHLVFIPRTKTDVAFKNFRWTVSPWILPFECSQSAFFNLFIVSKRYFWTQWFLTRNYTLIVHFFLCLTPKIVIWWNASQTEFKTFSTYEKLRQNLQVQKQSACFHIRLNAKIKQCVMNYYIKKFNFSSHRKYWTELCFLWKLSNRKDDFSVAAKSIWCWKCFWAFASVW